MDGKPRTAARGHLGPEAIVGSVFNSKSHPTLLGGGSAFVEYREEKGNRCRDLRTGDYRRREERHGGEKKKAKPTNKQKRIDQRAIPARLSFDGAGEWPGLVGCVGKIV